MQDSKSIFRSALKNRVLYRVSHQTGLPSSSAVGWNGDAVIDGGLPLASGEVSAGHVRKNSTWVTKGSESSLCVAFAKRPLIRGWTRLA